MSVLQEYDSSIDPKELMLRQESRKYLKPLSIGGAFYLVALIVLNHNPASSIGVLFGLIGLGVWGYYTSTYLRSYSKKVYLLNGEVFPEKQIEISHIGEILNNQDDVYAAVQLKPLKIGSIKNANVVTSNTIVESELYRFVALPDSILVTRKKTGVTRLIKKSYIRVERTRIRSIINNLKPVRVLSTRWLRETKAGKKTNAADNTEFDFGDYYFVIINFTQGDTVKICIDTTEDIVALIYYFTGKVEDLVPVVNIAPDVVEEQRRQIDSQYLYSSNHPSYVQMIKGALLNEVDGKDASYLMRIVSYYLKNQSYANEARLKALIRKLKQ